MWQKINKHKRLIHLVLVAAVMLVILSPLAEAQAQRAAEAEAAKTTGDSSGRGGS